MLRFCFPTSWPGPTPISVLHPTSLALWLPDASGWLWPKGRTCQKLEVVREPGGDLSLPPPSSGGRHCPCLPEPSTFHSSSSRLGTSGLRGSSGQSLSLREQFLPSRPPAEGAACFPTSCWNAARSVRGTHLDQDLCPTSSAVQGKLFDLSEQRDLGSNPHSAQRGDNPHHRSVLTHEKRSQNGAWLFVKDRLRQPHQPCEGPWTVTRDCSDKSGREPESGGRDR